MCGNKNNNNRNYKKIGNNKNENNNRNYKKIGNNKNHNNNNNNNKVIIIVISKMLLTWYKIGNGGMQQGMYK